MKTKLLSALLLLCCFGALAILSGAIPVLAEEESVAAGDFYATEEVAVPTEIITAVPTPTYLATPEAANELEMEVSPTPEATYVPTPTPVPEATPVPAMPDWSLDTTVLSTTVTGDILNNGTDYQVDVSALLTEELSLTLPAEGYQILIMHTHGTEAYTPEGDDVYQATAEYRTTDINYSVVRVGQALADTLSAYGLRVLHDTELYDYPSYNGSYARSGEAIEAYLAENPGIALIIDLHRDALGEGDTIYKTVTQAAGETVAQIMFVMGSDVNLSHPNWRENLTLALTLQQTVATRYETLMRPTTLCDYRYNQQLTTGSLLMEVGTAGNTLQEAITAVQLFADAVAPTLLSLVE
ncbi:MAG: stage II sporulation protein P [Oscillospiraceae bacterium]|nr:stage II sporulation protein P [Oscillospiraceae bacterium]